MKIWIRKGGFFSGSVTTSEIFPDFWHPPLPCRQISKCGFFSESAICFSNLPISQKRYSKKLSWAWNDSIMLWAGILNFKFRIVVWNIFLEIGRFEKQITLSEKKPHSEICRHRGGGCQKSGKFFDVVYGRSLICWTR